MAQCRNSLNVINMFLMFQPQLGWAFSQQGLHSRNSPTIKRLTQFLTFPHGVQNKDSISIPGKIHDNTKWACFCLNLHFVTKKKWFHWDMHVEEWMKMWILNTHGVFRLHDIEQDDTCSALSEAVSIKSEDIDRGNSIYQGIAWVGKVSGFPLLM